MSEQGILKEEKLLIIKELETKPAVTQRDLSHSLGFSLGKTNYLLKELIKKGLVEVNNFSSNPGKASKIHYILTEEGIKHKIELMQHFLRAKEKEYMRLKTEWEALHQAEALADKNVAGQVESQEKTKQGA